MTLFLCWHAASTASGTIRARFIGSSLARPQPRDLTASIARPRAPDQPIRHAAYYDSNAVSSGNLTLADATRSKTNQREASKPDRLRTDDGGHFIAARFNGPSDKINHFAQDANFNRGAYRVMEDK
ncbi:DNA/RNA non-specific endonuclease [Sphingomonas bacterium]|uniref:DNA/RNA non-specific endonuclease n=1 Tax=Sphingomonas bacterium TaxID=1895847 RepID=UPI0020C675DB|nr:DNA/RNA non-specific endonuclease [Sphingomonas bacterium]